MIQGVVVKQFNNVSKCFLIVKLQGSSTHAKFGISSLAFKIFVPLHHQLQSNL
jgi:hypothetical protein